MGPRRIPASYPAQLLGDNPTQTPAQREARITEILGKLEASRTAPAGTDGAELRHILIAPSQADRLQLNLPIP